MVQQAEQKPYWMTDWGPSYVSPYERWKSEQGLDTIRGWSVDNLYTVELKDWPARNSSGVFINLEGNEGFNDSYVQEINPGKSTVPIRHIYEDTIFILSRTWSNDSLARGKQETNLRMEDKQLFLHAAQCMVPAP